MHPEKGLACRQSLPNRCLKIKQKRAKGNRGCLGIKEPDELGRPQPWLPTPFLSAGGRLGFCLCLCMDEGSTYHFVGLICVLFGKLEV